MIFRGEKIDLKSPTKTKTSVHWWRPLSSFQKCVVRLITSSFLAYSEPLFLSLQILSVFDVYFFRSSIILFRYKHLPDCANSMFTKNCEIHGYCTQQAAWLQIEW